MFIFTADEIEAERAKNLSQDSNLMSSETNSLSSFSSAENTYFSVSVHLTSFVK